MILHHFGNEGTIYEGDAIEVLRGFEDETADMIFADPPYYLQLGNELRRPDESRVSSVSDEWDHFSSFGDYDSFTLAWLGECRRVLKPEGTIWVIGTYHNIFRIGRCLQDLGFWILNDVIWLKSNPMPNFRGRRFTNAHETLIWAKKSKDSGYTFNYWDMKSLNDDLQMRSDWLLPVCSGSERIRDGGKRAHSTQKPAALLHRVILSSTKPGDIVLDPFLGSGTTAVVAQSLGRKWIGIERDASYVRLSARRINDLSSRRMSSETAPSLSPHPSRRDAGRVSFGNLVESGFLLPGQFVFSRSGDKKAMVNADGSVSVNGSRGSIHKLSAEMLGRERANGWDYWFFYEGDELVSIDVLRSRYRELIARHDNIRGR